MSGLKFVSTTKEHFKKYMKCDSDKGDSNIFSLIQMTEKYYLVTDGKLS